MNWPSPGNDPFYVNNPTENTARRTYYGINAVFNMKCDGILGNSGSSYQTYYNQRCNIASPVAIDLQITVGATIHLTAFVTAENNFTGNNLKLRSSLQSIEYTIPGTGWTYTHCMNAMLDLAPDPAGINFNITPGQTVTLQTDFPIPTYPPTGLENLEIVAFVQNESSHEVLQARREQIPLDFPSLTIANYTINDDAPGGNGNGLPEPGETCDIWMTLQNGEIFAPATGVTAVLSTTDPGIDITNNNAGFPDIPSNGTGSNQADPFTFEVDPQFEAHNVEFQLDITANGGAWTGTQFLAFMVGIPSVLIVDDDGGQSYQTFYINALEEINVAYDIYEVNTQGAPSGALLSNYDKIIWFTGRETAPLNADEQAAVGIYLDNGGKLLMSSENLGDNIGTSDWYTGYMHASPGINHVTATSLNGIAGDPISEGTSLFLIGGAYWPDNQSTIFPDAEASTIYNYTNVAQDCGALKYDGEYMLVYTAFPMECVCSTNPSYTPMEDVMENILVWFGTTITTPDVTVAMSPIGMPIVIPAGGGNFSFDITLTNNEPTAMNIDVWTMATLPNGSVYGPILNVNATMNPGQIITRNRVQAVPASAPSGDYTYDAYVGDYPDDIWNEDHFDFSKSAADMGGGFTPDWNNWGESFEDNFAGASSSMPTKFALNSAYPDPFNPVATITFDLKESVEVNLTVFDISGRIVAALVNGHLGAGVHSAVFTADNLASGVYFYKLTAGSFTDTKKMVLMK